MQEKIMVSDTLFSINATLQNMGIIIAQTANPQLRHVAFIQIEMLPKLPNTNYMSWP